MRRNVLGVALHIGETRWLMLEQRAIPVPRILLGGLVFWLVALFFSFGLFAQPNATVLTGLMVSALAVSVAIFLIVEMYHPYSGLIHVSDAPMRAALLQLGR
jgi:hypothetical protein